LARDAVTSQKLCCYLNAARLLLAIKQSKDARLALLASLALYRWLKWVRYLWFG